MRATKTIVRPGRKNGGTTIVFAVRKRAVVRFTVVRIYPSCKRVGSFTIRARPGQNRVRFKGKLGKRYLADGVYRLLAQVRGHERAVASVTLVVARRQRNAIELRRARPTACSPEDAQAIEFAIGAAPPQDEAGWNRGGSGTRVASMADPVVGATKGVVRTAKRVAGTAKSVPGRIAEAAGGLDRVQLTVIGLGLLLIAVMGALVLLNIMRFGYRARVFR